LFSFALQAEDEKTLRLAGGTGGHSNGGLEDVCVMGGLVFRESVVSG